MQQQNIPISTLVDMYKRGELRLPEIQRHYVWRATRVRDLHREGPPSEVTEVEGDVESPLTPDDEDTDETEENGDTDTAVEERFKHFTFVVASRSLQAQPHWVSVSEVFKSASDSAVLRKAGVTSLDDPRYQKYSERLTKLRQVRNYHYVVHVLERSMSYQEVTEIFVRVNSLSAPSSVRRTSR